MDDLHGSSSERAAQLAAAETSELEAEWLARQLALVLAAWSVDETRLYIEVEGHIDF